MAITSGKHLLLPGDTIIPNNLTTPAGETLGAALYIWAGIFFNDRVQEVSAVLGDLTWVILGILAAAFLGWKLLGRRTVEAKTAGPAA